MPKGNSNTFKKKNQKTDIIQDSFIDQNVINLEINKQGAKKVYTSGI